MLNTFYIDEIIKKAFEEDMNYGDITTEALIPNNQISEGKLIAKEKGVLAGQEVFQRAFHILDEKMSVVFIVNEGDVVEAGTLIAIIKGKTKTMLKVERTALNLIQRMSGIATMTYQMVSQVVETNTRIVDTRKTTAGLRALEKYAVRVGGGYNHRFNLSDAVLIKDNHIKAVGSITKAIQTAKDKIPHCMKIEVEVEDLEQLQEAIEAGADIIMLDNMSIEQMKQAVEINAGRTILEASGNVSLSNVKEIASVGVDIISCGALTHSVKAMDISLRF